MTTPMLTDQPPTLADRIAEAAQAEAAPRTRVQELSAVLDLAVAEQDYAEADQLKTALHQARSDLAVAEAATAALRQGAVAVEAEQAAAEAKIAAAHQRDEANRSLSDAYRREERAQQQTGTALRAFWEAVAEAQRQFRAAQAAEDEINRARRAVLEARRQLGHWPADHPGPTPARANAVSVLAERNALVRQIAAWSQ